MSNECEPTKITQSKSNRLNQNQSKNKHHDQNQQYKSRLLLGIFIGSIIGFIILVFNRPQLSNKQFHNHLTFPPSPKDLYIIAKVLTQYREQHLAYSLFAFVYLYVLLQAFAIPGPVFLCIISSTLYGPVPGFCLSLTCSCLGASLCFLLSQTLAKSLVLRKFPALFAKFNSMVMSNQSNLFWYMLFLRFTPLIPNWFVNLASPLVGMPYKYFLIASFFGMMPNNFILIQTGLTLKQIDSIGISPRAFISLLILGKITGYYLGFLSLIPTFIGKYYSTQSKVYTQIPQNQ